jgi:hypothetical protein
MSFYLTFPKEAPMADPKKPADANRDPLSGAPGAHPVGVGAGAASAGAAGAAVGGAVGAVAGGLAGKGAAEAVNPTVEGEYWRKNYSSRPYASSGSYEEFQPAYQYGWESYSRHQGRKFDEVEPELRRDWEKGKANTKLGWDKARGAARDAWDRVERAMPGDFDKDGR